MFDDGFPPTPPRGGLARFSLLLGGLVLAGAWNSRAEDSLTLLPRDSEGHVRLRQEAEEGRVIRLEATDDWSNWVEIGRAHGTLDNYPDLQSLEFSQRFYRTRQQPRTNADDWKNQVRYADDPFLSAPTWSSIPEPRWIKFAIVTSETNKVYFQDSAQYPFHYEFAVKRLPGFTNLSRAQFDQLSLHPANQEAVLGALLFPPSESFRELGVQLVGLEPYGRERLVEWLGLVRSVLALPPDVTVRYFPVYEQAAAAETHRAYLEARGFPLGSVSRWVTADQVYSVGWALGRLVFIPAAEIAAAYSDGRLKATDILVTDGIPAELPP